MTVQECYDFLEADYDNTLERFGQEERMMKYLLKFAQDKSFCNLVLRLGERNYAEAFRFAHDLKGLCLNLGLTCLFENSSRLCEALRDTETPKDIPYLLQAVMNEYERTVAAIGQLS